MLGAAYLDEGRGGALSCGPAGVPEGHADYERRGADPGIDARVKQVRFAPADGTDLASKLDRVVEPARQAGAKKEREV